MQAVSSLRDARINASNILLEMTIDEYIEIAGEIIKNNIFQRRRVGSSKTVYSLLKQDLMRECVIPPIVLALTSGSNSFHDDLSAFPVYLGANKNHLVILDGLQRTYTILDLINDLERSDNIDELTRVRKNKVRVEVQQVIPDRSTQWLVILFA